METIKLQVVRPAGRYDGQRRLRLITGHLPCGPLMHANTSEPCGRDLYVVEGDGYTKIVAADTTAVVGSGRGLQEACADLAETYGVAVEALRLDGTRMCYAVPDGVSQMAA